LKLETGGIEYFIIFLQTTALAKRMFWKLQLLLILPVQPANFLFEELFLFLAEFSGVSSTF